MYNLLELAHFVLFVYYYIIRIGDRESTFPPHMDQLDEATRTVQE